jgi:hypothetical protein
VERKMAASISAHCSVSQETPRRCAAPTNE